MTKTADLNSSVRTYYSRELIEKALPMLVFRRFAKVKTDLEREPGDSITFTKFSELDEGQQLTEGVALTEQKITDDEVKIEVNEFGKATSVSEVALVKNMFDVLEEQTKKLAKSYVKTVDSGIRDICLTTSNAVYGGGKTAANLLTTADVFDTAIVKDAVERLSENDAPKFDNEYYICVATPHQMRHLRDDEDWLNVHQYARPEDIFRGEVGMYEGVRFIETTQMPKLTPTQSLAKYGVNIYLYEAIIFGENAFGFAEALPVELRDNGVEDYGRKHGLAWYSIYGMELIDEDYIFLLLTA